MLHRVFSWVVPKCKLAEVQAVIGGYVARDSFCDTGVDESFLAVDHKVVGTEVATDAC